MLLQVLSGEQAYQTKALSLYLRRRGYGSQPKEQLHPCGRDLYRLVMSAWREAKP